MAEPERVQITMPQMGESVSEGTVLTWHKKEGDWIDKGETVVEVSTEKIDPEVPAPASGKLAKIVAQEDETVAVGDVLGEIEASQEGPGGDVADDGRVGARRPAMQAESDPQGGGSDDEGCVHPPDRVPKRPGGAGPRHGSPLVRGDGGEGAPSRP